MSQSDFGIIDPNIKDGATLATDLNSWRTALHSSHKGPAEPAYKIAGMLWVDDTNNPNWDLKFYDGSDWIIISTIDTTGNTSSGQSSGTSGSGGSGNPMQSIQFSKVF